MTSVPKYVTRFVDHKGYERFRFRRKGVSTYIHGRPGTKEFDDRYAELLSKTDHPKPQQFQAGTVRNLIRDFKNSARYLKLSPKTRISYDRSFALFDDVIGDAFVSDITRALAFKLQDEFRDQPATANAHLRHLKLLMSFAIDREYISQNPFLRIKQLETDEWRDWREDEIATFLDKVPEDKLARRVVILALTTAQRRSDLARMSVEDIVSKRIRVKQDKTDAVLEIPIHPDLQAELDKRPPIGAYLLHDANGNQLRDDFLTKSVKQACVAVGLPDDLKLHGLRKAACRRLAEAGCSAHEIQAISGHQTLQMLSKYTKAASQRDLADAAFQKSTRVSR